MERPTAAFILSLIGLTFQILGASLLAYATLFYPLTYSSSYSYQGMWMMRSGMMFGWPFMYGPSYLFPLFTIVVVVMILGVLGVIWMNSINLSRVRAGSIMVLIASLIAFPTMFGFMIGSLLMLIGSTLGLTWQPRRS